MVRLDDGHAVYDKVEEHVWSLFRSYPQDLKAAYESVSESSFVDAYNLLNNAANLGDTIYTCGNGGSAAIANHLTCDCLKGVREKTKLVPKVVSLVSNVPLMTAIANDVGYEDVFSYQLESLGKMYDLLVVISSSGNSLNVIKAAEKAKELDMNVLAMVGFSGGKVKDLADVVLHVKSNDYGIVEDVHQALMHGLAKALQTGPYRNKVQ